MKPLNKGAYFTDIHFGKKANSPLHNQDCIEFITWFCDKVRNDPEIDYICFLGDWHENRSSINIQTLKFSHFGAKMLNDLNLPIYFLIGNHDLYYRHTREIHSITHFEEFPNIKLIDDIYYAPPEEITNGALFCPYLFHDEYESLRKFNNVPTWLGHFEFKGFQITGYNLIMPTGPDPENFTGPDYIFSGHFHKRQANQNVFYIGNTFPMDYGDAGDNQRGMITYNHSSKQVEMFDWEQCPKYIKTTLSDLLDKNCIMYNNARVKCVIDIPISFEESGVIKQKYTDQFKLREFILEESSELLDALTKTETKADVGDELATVDDLVIQMLTDITAESIDNELLISIYRSSGEIGEINNE